ncbi:hypothetical protein IYX23_07730 [Methylocystis sp. L43]|uniref:hypothetical protein n=1 Tax=unclassified Methylocystis TaxID=2625913 RepID=UPI0018C1D72B|nr:MULTISPECIES: hypothetical protein [unclassified Methylocystis]MBG0797556.1 hypothetical protein [Methylocystis sp. L43]MBG0805160.1 hypothetical protein [Methylocystis sp. H15]
MSVLDFLKVKKSAPASQIAEMEASLARLRTERKEFETVVESHGARRADALLSDMADADIAKLDADASLAQIRLERLELAELELVERIERARDKAERERLASEHERAAAQIETAAKALEGPIAQLAAAFASLVEAIPTETGVAKDYENHLTPCPAESIDVAQAIAAAALHSAIPGLFERLTLVRRGSGQPLASPAPVARLYDLGALRIGGRVSGDPAPLPAPVAAHQLIVVPQREKARALRHGDAERLEAAE